MKFSPSRNAPPKLKITAARVCCVQGCQSLSKDFYPHPSNPHWMMCKLCYEDEIRRRTRTDMPVDMKAEY